MDKGWTKGVLTHPKILGLVQGGTVHHNSRLFPFRASDTQETTQALVADSQVNSLCTRVVNCGDENHVTLDLLHVTY